LTTHVSIFFLCKDSVFFLTLSEFKNRHLNLFCTQYIRTEWLYIISRFCLYEYTVSKMQFSCAMCFLQYIEDNLSVMSIGFLLSSPDDAIIWRGPKKNGMFLFCMKCEQMKRISGLATV
jgi:hypothetical protein